MSDFQAIADRVEIEALRGEFTDAGMMLDYDRFASLFTPDGVWRIPAVNAEFAGREEIRAGIKRLAEGLWDYLVQTTHPGTIRLDGDTASGRAYVLSFGRFRDGGSHLNYSVYHDRYQRTPGGWKFTERVDEIKYLDTTPLAGSAPPPPPNRPPHPPPPLHPGPQRGQPRREEPLPPEPTQGKGPRGEKRSCEFSSRERPGRWDGTWCLDWSRRATRSPRPPGRPARPGSCAGRARSR